MVPRTLTTNVLMRTVLIRVPIISVMRVLYIIIKNLLVITKIISLETFVIGQK